MKILLKPYLMLLPVLIILIGILGIGVMTTFTQSIGYFSAIGSNDFTLDNYMRLLTDKGLIESLVFSMRTSFISAFISTLGGVILAVAVYKLGYEGDLLSKSFRIPIIVPHLLSVLLIYNIFSQTGILARILFSLGVIDSFESFPQILYLKNGFGIILAYVWKELPFIAFITYNVLSKLSTKLSDAARNLGANSFQAMRYVVIPLLIPSILSSFILVFAFSFGAYEIPMLLGATYPKALPVKAYIEYINPMLINRPYAMAINFFIASMGLFLAYIYFKCFERVTRYEKQ